MALVHLSIFTTPEQNVCTEDVYLNGGHAEPQVMATNVTAVMGTPKIVVRTVSIIYFILLNVV